MGILGAFWSFSSVWGNFGYSWCILVILAVLGGLFYTFWYIYRFFHILEIFTGEIIFLTKKTTEITRMAIILTKSPKYSKTTKCPKKKSPRNLLTVQNSQKARND